MRRPARKKEAVSTAPMHWSSPEEREFFHNTIAAIYAASEEQRHRAEVRTVIRMRANGGEDAPRVYISIVRKKRGDAAADKLMADAVDQWKKGMRDPTPSEWRK